MAIAVHACAVLSHLMPWHLFLIRMIGTKSRLGV